MLSTSQLNEKARKLKIPNFHGVFAWNELPTSIKKKHYSFIINTDASNLQGQHWVAVLVRTNRQAFVFDSYGVPPPLRLQHWLNIRGIKWTANPRQLQPPKSTMCGYYCLYFLWFANLDFLKTSHFNEVVDILFPHFIYSYKNENIITQFVTIFKI